MTILLETHAVEHLAEREQSYPMDETPPALHDETPLSLHEVERLHIAHVLQVSGGNQRRAARILDISRWSLARRLSKYGLRVRAE
jgi:DNA-binding protein Fis